MPVNVDFLKLHGLQLLCEIFCLKLSSNLSLLHVYFCSRLSFFQYSAQTNCFIVAFLDCCFQTEAPFANISNMHSEK